MSDALDGSSTDTRRVEIINKHDDSIEELARVQREQGYTLNHLDARTSKMANMMTDNDARLERIEASNARAVELLERLVGDTAVTDIRGAIKKKGVRK